MLEIFVSYIPEFTENEIQEIDKLIIQREEARKEIQRCR